MLWTCLLFLLVQDLITSDAACPAGQFGWKCKLSCANCANGACHEDRAECLKGCKPGFFGKHCLLDENCKYDNNGVYYLGNKAVTKTGKQCIEWSQVDHDYHFEVDDFPRNYCRNPSHLVEVNKGRPSDPWCYVSKEKEIDTCEFKYCEKCPEYLFGEGCRFECHCINGTECDHNGICRLGCGHGWIGDTCNEACTRGNYGLNCKKSCPNCLNQNCDHVNGVCLQGCVAGFTGPMCTESCLRKFGRDCSKDCGKCRNGTVCDKRTGHCRLGCEPGYTSSNPNVVLCDQVCQGRYGHNCFGKCGECKGKVQCHRTTGECPDGCLDGYTSKLCNRICDSHFYGADCAQKCGSCKYNESCDPFTGGCRAGCVEGHTGFLCIQRIANNDDPSAAVLFGASAGIIIAAILILLLLCFVYKKRRHKHLHMSKADRTVEYVDDHITRGESCQLLGDSRVGSEPTSATREEDEITKNEPIYVNVTNRKQSLPVQVPDLYDYICKNKERSCEGFKREFEELPMGLLAQCDIARKPENKSKNRYGNIVAYDHSRVILDPLPNEPFSDYVNANFMDGYSRKQMYIASQGPNKVMIRDFWRMVWQHRVSKIVMLTNLIEACKKKCEQYWPDEGTQKYGDLSVFIVNTTKYSDFVIRTFELSKENENSRIVIQFHFTTWSDHGAPTYPTTLLAFRRKVINFKPEDTAPILSHCSAGIGRTGTFIAMNYLLEQAQAEGVVDVLKCAQQMRINRVNMIQTLEQYVFVYDAVLEAILAAVTTISRSNFRSKFEEMLNTNGQQETQMERQYNVLQQLSPTIEREECSAALQEENMAKNRFKNILPANRNRTFLQTPVEGCNDYINAVYLSSYTQKDQFIVTQMPLPTTLPDFWRMMYDTCSNTIIMLNEFDRNDKSCALYWPEEYGYCETYSPLSVELLSSSDVDPDVTIRVFKLSHLEKNEERAIKQFMLKSWPDYQTTPSSTTPLLRLHCLVNDWLKQISKGPVTIHCMNGASKSGVLVATSLLLERLELDYEVDVYQTVKQIRINRPQFIENLEQYTFLYQVVQDYLDQE